MISQILNIDFNKPDLLHLVVGTLFNLVVTDKVPWPTPDMWYQNSKHMSDGPMFTEGTVSLALAPATALDASMYI